jgi:hypothetical protein
VDTAFAEAMADVYNKHPGHHEIATVYAVALFMLEERRGYRDIEDESAVHLLDVLTGVLDEDIRHPGACHLYIHATESTRDPGRALACAEYLGEAIRREPYSAHAIAYLERGRPLGALCRS